LNDLITRIQANIGHFSKSQKLIAKFIIEHYNKAAFMTAGKLGLAVGVSESTVVRFATELGYDGYPQLQRALQEIIRNKLTTVQRMEVASDRIGNKDVLETILLSDMEKIRNTLEEIDRDVFNKVVEEILSAHCIYIMGVRSSAPLARFMSLYFNLLFPNIKLVHTNSESEIFEQLIRIGEHDIFIGISFPRYSKRTIKAMQFAQKRGATVVALTDSTFSPLVPCANHLLVAKSDIASFGDSLVAPLSVINALIAATSMRKKEEISENFNLLENIWEEYQVYEKTFNWQDKR